MIDRLRSIAVFTVAAEAGSFRAAARRLGLSPSVVSHHVSVLEAEFGLALFYRNTRKLALTEPGSRLLEHGRKMISAAEAGLDSIADRAENASGHLRLSAPALLQEGHFVADAAHFMELHPRVRLSIQFTDTGQSLLDSGLDLALRVGKMDDSAFKTRRIIGGTHMLCASPTFLGGSSRIGTPDELAKCLLIAYPGMSNSIALTSRTSSAVATLPSRLSVDSGHSARAFALQSQGIAVLPRFFVAHMIADGSLVEVLPEWNLPTFDIYAVWPANAGTRSLTKLFVDFLVGELSDNPPLSRVKAHHGSGLRSAQS